MKVLITGGAGYVGNALAQQLSQEKNIQHIHIYDNLSNGKHVLLQQVTHSPKLQFSQADILDNHRLKEALKDTDIVVHLATVKHATAHHYMEQINHWGTANIVNLIEEFPIKRFVFLSTAQLYPTSSEATTITTTANPKTPYAQSMWRAEKYIETLAKKCEVAIVRTANAYGYNPAMQFASGINKHVFEAKYNNLLQLDADGLHTQSAIHINDLAKLLLQLTLEKSQQPLYLSSTEQWNGMEIYEALKTFFPKLEATFTSHHLRLSDHLIQADDTTLRILKKQTKRTKAIAEILSKTNF